MHQVLIRCLVIIALALRGGANISRTCTQPALQCTSTLSAMCTNDKSLQGKTSIDLNTCIGFTSDTSNLICGYYHFVLCGRSWIAHLYFSHGYTSSCTDCYLGTAHPYQMCCLTCNVQGKITSLCINLSKFVDNRTSSSVLIHVRPMRREQKWSYGVHPTEISIPNVIRWAVTCICNPESSESK